MNAERLLASFGRVVDSPAAIQQLRAFVLALAVRGRLTPQQDVDGPAPRFDKSPTPASEAPFEIPITWQWARLHTLGRFKGGGTPSKTQEEFWSGAIPWVSPKDMKVDYLADAQMHISQSAISGSAASLIESGSVLFVVRGMILAHSFPVALARVELTINQDMKALVLHDAQMAEYLLRALKALKPQVLKRVRRSTHGTCRIDGPGYRDLLVPIPPVPEQRRIVARVDELMTLCDRLDTARAERETKRERVTMACFSRLNTPDPDLAGFANYARFALDILPTLTARLDQIRRLRQTVRNLGVRGKLVPQDPDDRSALVAARRLRPKDAEASFEHPLKVPTNWGWVSVADVAEARLGKMLDRSKNKGVPRRYLRNASVRWFDFDLSDILEMRFEDSELAEFELRAGDVLICEGGEPGRAAVWDEREPNIYFQKAIHRVRFDQLVDPHYFVNALRASADDGRLAEFFTGVGIKHLTGKGLEQYVFPLPPLDEQRRIVTKLQELMALCDRLEAILSSADTTRRRLLDALLAEALAPVSKELHVSQ
jgi:type I restriction enzyme, S subunit